MTDYVVDTNVWIWVETDFSEVNTKAELECIENCAKWFDDFSENEHRLVVDVDHRILTEYYTYARQGSRTRRLLNHFKTEPRSRLVEVSVSWDKHKYAKVPPPLEVIDPSDRKFVAVALAHDPRPTIVAATDRGWAKWRQELETAQIVVERLCEEYMRDKLERRSIS
jgi:hypothetical protein